MDHDGKGNEDPAQIPDAADDGAQDAQFVLERAFPFIVLEFLCQFSINGQIPNAVSPHNAFTLKDDGTAVDGIGLEKIDFFRVKDKGRIPRNLRSFFTFPVEDGLVHLEGAGEHDPIGRDLITRLEDDGVSLYDIGNAYFLGLPIPIDLAENPRGFFLEFLKGVFVGIFRIGADKSRQKDGKKDSHRFQPVSMSRIDKDDIDDKGGREDPDHGIFEVSGKLLPECLLGRTGQFIASILGTRGFCFLSGQTILLRQGKDRSFLYIV